MTASSRSRQTAGVALLVGAVLYAIVSLILRPFGFNARPWTHLLMFVVAMFGLQFVLLGILGEYVGRTFDEAKARPLYIIRDKIPVRGSP